MLRPTGRSYLPFYLFFFGPCVLVIRALVKYCVKIIGVKDILLLSRSSGLPGLILRLLSVWDLSGFSGILRPSRIHVECIGSSVPSRVFSCQMTSVPMISSRSTNFLSFHRQFLASSFFSSAGNVKFVQGILNIHLANVVIKHKIWVQVANRI